MRPIPQFDHIDWNMAIDHYYWDRMEAAYETAEPLGVGLAGRYVFWYRSIEAEYITRKQSERRKLADWLELETIPHEVGGREERVAEIVLAACDDVARRFGWEHGPPTLVSVLAAETDAPWTLGRYGFCVDKHPYDKVCLPNKAVFNERELRATTAHEYAHVITLNLSDAKVPRYLDEAVAMLAQGEFDEEVRREFVSGELEWYGPDDLDSVYVEERHDEAADDELWLAYQQSAQIGRYLASLKGEKALGDLMRAHFNNSIWTELKINVTSDTHTSEALREVYGMTEEQLFERALAWLKAGER
jgi:hypothetical protein